MSTPPTRLHELEAEIMDVIWDRPRRAATVRQVVQALARRGAKERAYTTILTVCSRLAEKQVLVRTTVGQTGVYEARLTREEHLEARAAVGVDELLEETGELALVHFARRVGSLDPVRRAALEELMSSD